VAASLAALLAAPLAGGCERLGTPARSTAPPDSAAGETAFRLAGPGGAALVVPVRLNGRGPYDLILDTGATFTCVDDTLARELGLRERRDAIGAGVGVGGAGRVRLYRLDSLRVGGASAEGITVCGLDLAGLAKVSPGTRGLLGLNFLKSYRVTLDFKREVVRLETP
jgi:predicted aspartyl protease